MSHPVRLRSLSVFALGALALSIAACSSAPDSGEGDGEGDDETGSESQGLGQRCTPRPPPISCRIWMRDERQSIGCSSRQGVLWRETLQSGCVRVPGAVCDSGANRRATQREAQTWPPCR